jgi:hypothetical protein
MLLVSYIVLLSTMLSPKDETMIHVRFRRSMESDFSRCPPIYHYVLGHGKYFKSISMANKNVSKICQTSYSFNFH